eukprot:1196048-Prorocentrum_minimum.AAC.3
MFRLSAFVCLVCFVVSAAAGSVWPKPQTMDIPENSTLLVLAPVFNFKVTGVQSDTLTQALERYSGIIFSKGGLRSSFIY